MDQSHLFQYPEVYTNWPQRLDTQRYFTQGPADISDSDQSILVHFPYSLYSIAFSKSPNEWGLIAHHDGSFGYTFVSAEPWSESVADLQLNSAVKSDLC